MRIDNSNETKTTRRSGVKSQILYNKMLQILFKSINLRKIKKPFSPTKGAQARFLEERRVSKYRREERAGAEGREGERRKGEEKKEGRGKEGRERMEGEAK